MKSLAVNNDSSTQQQVLALRETPLLYEQLYKTNEKEKVREIERETMIGVLLCFKGLKVSSFEERWNTLTLKPPGEALLTSVLTSIRCIRFFVSWVPGRARGGGHLERLWWRRLTLTWRLMCLQLKVTIAWTDAYYAHHLGCFGLEQFSVRPKKSKQQGKVRWLHW